MSIHGGQNNREGDQARRLSTAQFGLAALDHLVQLHPALATKLFDNGVLRHYINIYVNDEDIRYLDDLDTPVKDAEIVALIPAVAGG